MEIRPGSDADLPRLVAALGQRHLLGVPTFTHLEVLGPFQRRGIGTALIHAGEDTARRLGDHHLAIGVGLDNPGARRLYERLGYTDWGHGSLETSWQDHDHAGHPVTVTEAINLLVSRL